MPTPATFYTISVFPYSQLVTAADFNAGSHSGGVAHQVWFKYTSTLDIVLGLVTTATLADFAPAFQLFGPDASTPITPQDSADDDAAWFRLQTIQDYWIRVKNHVGGGGGNIANDFTFSADTRQIGVTPEPGDFLINDDTYPFLGCVLKPDGTVRGYVAMAAGEQVAGLPSGHVLVQDTAGGSVFGSKLALFGPTLALISAFDTSPTISGEITAGSNRTFFYFQNPANKNVYRLDTSGVVTLMTSSIAVFSKCLGVNMDGSILYYVQNVSDATNPVIKRWNLTSDSAMSDLYTITGSHISVGYTAINGHNGELVVLSDGSIVTYYQQIGGGLDQSVLIHVSAAGVLLHSYTYTYAGTALQIDHISRAPNDPTEINVWFYHNGDNFGVYETINIATGVARLTSGDVALFSAGNNLNSIIGPPASSAMFGPSSSCGFTTLLADSVAPTDPTSNPTENPESGSSGTVDSCCSHSSPGEPGPEATAPNPVGPMPPWMASCIGAGLVDSALDLDNGEVW